MIGTQPDRSRVVMYGLCFLLSCYSSIKFNYKDYESSFFQKLVVEMVGPIQAGSVSFHRFFKRFVNNYLYIVDTRKQNSKLHEKILELEERNFNLLTVEKENKRLKKLLKFGSGLQQQKILAQVIAWESVGDHKSFRINKGLNEGIKKNMAVITSEGLVGKTFRVTRNYSDILTITDQSNRVDVVIDRTRVSGIVEGLGKHECRLKYIARNVDIAKGDVLVTAGYGTTYPRGIKVGEVSKMQLTGHGLTQDISILPSVDFSRLEEVAVLVPIQGDESQSFEPEAQGGIKISNERKPQGTAQRKNGIKSLKLNRPDVESSKKPASGSSE